MKKATAQRPQMPGLWNVRPKAIKMGTTSISVDVMKPQDSRGKFLALEKKRELEEHYLPGVEALTDHDLLGELNYWWSRSRVPYPEGSPQAKFLEEILQIQFFFNRRKGPLSAFQRRNVIRACVSLRSRRVPFHMVKASASMGTEAKEMPKHIISLASFSDWQLVQRLASRVGSCNMKLSELGFVSHCWKLAWSLGPEKFKFKPENDAERWRAEQLLTSLIHRDPELKSGQIELFKQWVGVRKIPVWDLKSPEPNLF